LPCCDELYGTKFLLDWENAVLNLCNRHGVALEISGFWRLPNMDMLRRAKAMGLSFSMGSDCHEAKDVGVLDYCLRAVEELGLQEEDFFVPARALK
jgi:histidinol phosphatase-like PHP family hydrolase